MLSVTALAGIPEVRAGDELSTLLADAVARSGLGTLHGDDVIVVAHKVVSKAEGRVRRLADVTPSARARELAAVGDKDPRHVQVVLDESREVLRAVRGVIICVTHHGFVCANAGVDASNAAEPGTVIMLPEDPDASARRIRTGLRERTGAAPGVIVTDSFGRAWRHGQCDVAIGAAGIVPLEDWRGRSDGSGRELNATVIAAADELAAAADLTRSKDGRQPAMLIRGAGRHVCAEDGPGAGALIRPESHDLFR